ncbi:hypothetical protein JCM10212_000034 [Sporobolomyces blumeae]
MESDAPPLSSFVHAESFIRDAHTLSSFDPAGEPSQEQDALERVTVERMCQQLDEYQEQSYLLDPALESLVSPLIHLVRDHVLACSTEPSSLPIAQPRVHRVARVLYFITKVRGGKTVLRFFPHEVTDLVHLLSLFSPSTLPSDAPTIDPLSHTTWELRYVLLLWLSLCVRLPFDLSKLHEGTATKIVESGERWLGKSGKEREGGIEVLARFYARQDAPLEDLVEKCQAELQKDDNLLFSSGLVQTLCIVLKTSTPSHLSPHFSSLYRLLAFVPSDSPSTGAVLGKYRLKLAGRLALMRLGNKAGSEDDVPEEVEVVLGELLEGLSHPDTIVRWSAAKYLARLTSPLPASFASDVLSSILSLFEECLSEADRTEHGLQGACFAFGEMGRRGIMTSGAEDTGRLLEGVMQALLFDRRRNMQTIGTSVRDSAAYVLWSLARTLTPAEVQPFAQRLAERLVCVALFDREVSIRRAASAAFQEGVGRWGVFPHGIDVLRKIDFFTVSVRPRAYLSAAPCVAEHEEYRPSIIEHLVSVGVSHYDPEIRELSAKALGKVVSLDAKGLVDKLVDERIANLSSLKDAARLHGCLLSLSALADAASNLDEPIRATIQRKVFSSTVRLVDDPSPGRLFRTSPLVLFAALSALTTAAPSPSTAPVTIESKWSAVLDYAKQHTDERVHEQAGAAIRRISQAVEFWEGLLTLIADLDSKKGTTQQASALLLGQIDLASHNASRLASVVERLSAFVLKDGKRSAGTVEARRNGVEALASVLRDQHDLQQLPVAVCLSAFDAISTGFEDYTADQRGDIGSWVRAATIKSLTILVPQLLLASNPYSAALGQDRVDDVVASFAKLAVERLDNVREAAGRGLAELANVAPSTSGLTIKGRNVCDELVDTAGDERDWRNLDWASERVLPLLAIPEYRSKVLQGALIATHQHSSSTPFVDYLLLLDPISPTHAPSSISLHLILTDLYSLAKRNFSTNKLFIPYLYILSSLAESGALEGLVQGSDTEAGEGERVLRLALAIATSSIGKIKAAPRLVASSKVVTSFLAVPSLGVLAAEKLSPFLLHPLTWIRQSTVDDLFGIVSTLDLDFDPAEAESLQAELESLIADTEWSKENCEAQATRIVELLKLGLAPEEKSKLAR